ncbi:MAG: PBP1A family penicillin-binding protein [Deltaproteobacteria bacterium]|nr:MAG: PBP1A family penicillin-binding protein [Deltaproteobacteria bacterium]
MGRWLAWRLAMLALGAGLGLACVVGILYRQALADVDDLLARPVWSRTGRVLSAPLELWPGLRLTPDELALDLQRAGLARVARAERPGDFEVGADRVRILLAAASGPGFEIEPGERVVRFAEGRVASISGGRRLLLPPSELAEVRGPANEARRPVTLAEIPPQVVDAVLAMEDARFREHEGLDPLGIARALLVNVVAGRTVQGGSTLTQQTVKNLFLTQERSYERKAREALLAVALERRRSKDEILELYLNEIYLGQVGGAAVCGVDQAARAYFGKPVERLSLSEAAIIAGIISAPNRYSPLKHPEAAIARRDLALDRMAELGFIDAATADAEKARPLQVHAITEGRRSPWAVDAALETVESELGEGTVAARGLVVHTTIQPALQRLAERAVADAGAALERAHPDAAGAQLALVAVRARDGAIVAMVGGRDYARSQFNRALHARRQIGSTVKPLTWLFAMEADHDLGPGSVVVDEPIERMVDGRRWAPRNHDGLFVGPVSLRDALVHSRNVPAVLVAERVGLSELKRRWQAAGLTGATDWPSAALGSFSATPVELARAYTAFVNEGRVVRPRLLRGTDDGSGQVVLESPPVQGERVADAEAAWMVGDTLRDVIAAGTGRGAARFGVGDGAGGKTGTTDDGRDAWFAGFSGDLVVVAWAGFDKGEALGLTGAQAALPAWARFVAAAGTRGGLPRRPAGLVQREVCAETGTAPCEGLLSSPCEDRVTDWFRADADLSADCGGGKRLRLIDRLRKGQQAGNDEGSVDGSVEGSVPGETRRARRKRRRQERRAGSQGQP